MITIKKIVPQTVEVYHDDGEGKTTFVGTVNEYEFNDLRIQIKNAQATGYFVSYNNSDIYIYPNGCLSHWAEGLFDLFEKQLDILTTWEE